MCVEDEQEHVKSVCPPFFTMFVTHTLGDGTQSSNDSAPLVCTARSELLLCTPTSLGVDLCHSTNLILLTRVFRSFTQR